MYINLENTSICNAQLGDNNVMYVNGTDTNNLLKEKDWKELEIFLNRRLSEMNRQENSYFLAKDALAYTEKKDERGLKNFLRRNKDTFFTNVLSDIASSGLILLLTKISF